MSKLPRFHNKHIEKRKYSNSLLAKSISSKVRFSNKTFFNVNLRGSRLRSCSFKNIKIVLSDFSGVILNKNRFTNVHFEKCVFYAAIFRDCRFKNCTFEKCIFINTNTESLNHSILDCSKKYNFYEMKIPDDLKDQLTEYRNIPILQKNRLLHLKGGRINTATLFILLSKISKYKLLNGLKKIYIEEQSKVKILSTFKLLEEIKNLVDTNTAFKQNNGALPHPIERLDS